MDAEFAGDLALAVSPTVALPLTGSGFLALLSHMEKRTEVYPVLKAHDTEHPVSYIYCDEDVELPSGKVARVSFHFDSGNSFEEMQHLISTLKEKRMKIIMDSTPLE